MTIPLITSLPPAADLNTPSTINALATAFFNALEETFVDEVNASITAMNAVAVQVSGTGTFTNLTSQGSLTVTTTSALKGDVTVGETGNDTHTILIATSATGHGTLATSEELRFSTATADAMVIDDSGFVGIGAASPDAILHIKHDSEFLRMSRVSDVTFTRFQTNVNGDFIIDVDPADDGSSQDFFVNVAGNQTIRARNNDIRFPYSGNSSIYAGIQIDAAGRMYLDADFGGVGSTPDIVFRRASTEGMRLAANGAGIGRSDPLEKLHVKDGTNTQILVEATSGYAGIILQNTSSGVAAGSVNGLQLTYSTAAFLWNYESTDLVLATNNAEALRLVSGGGVKMTGNLGFYGATPAAKPTITGSRAGNAALADLLNELATLGLITDSSTA